jgi:hypothetical protein
VIDEMGFLFGSGDNSFMMILFSGWPPREIESSSKVVVLIDFVANVFGFAKKIF